MPDAQAVESAGHRAVAVTGYFDERFWRSTCPNAVRRAGSYHRTLSTYLNALVSAGFTLEAADEPIADGRLARERPLYEHVPMFFAARVRRVESPT